ncbi:sulfatase : Sulfatase OS=Planctomyces limnophilus (strain ATCC 43296 / DSM 3776 / IFAM 1008 / 290) GN=Plim_1520 PE=4 SV=1: Sulfatase [Gemmataceae bacterium]|nr:sulfatase : Sulfatase OS=Planctomyces limnophilus (strain ATCC 43296 / DSM 3776 / IFAM 1008 / 290) GN=Plim_1520 PE=4 SV=1: Sulfatase [Gemmataceae bacterium]VTU02001.1 sulfatase : Sulfatase OS=Planctomyces limnophilus (strain ATCC 43296 / DSM 3776 / IFAM 1008 / 290) GN=Plim_1520 PE=4 SV=1: Sulfatase [Gemmataceae bacterium]
MNRILLALALLAFGPLLHAADKPNVVLIVVDDMGQRDLGCYGSTFYKTPNIDKMAKDGLRFTDFYAACPVCSPTRVSILTGKYPQRTGITDWIPGRKDMPDQRLKRPAIPNELPLDEVTLAEALKERGYATAHIGKWHLGGPGFEPTKQGFDVNIAGDQTGTPRSYFAPFANKSGQMPGLEKAEAGEYLTDRLAAEAEKFLDANKDKPFFLYLPHYGVHTPLQAKKDVVAKYNVKPRAGAQSNPVYAAMVESVDDAVGRVLKKLDDLKLSDNTLVIFTSDNGGLATTEGGPTGATFNGPLREGKGFLYEGGVRVPLIVKWPGKVKPGVTDQLACSTDFFATALDAAGERKPTDSKTDGVSLLPVFEGKKLADRALFWHYPHYANQGSRPGGAVRSGDHKLIEFYETGRRELFDVKKDVSESRNLAADRPEVVKELAAKLDAWRKEVGAKMPTPNPDYMPNPQAKDGTITLHARTALVTGTMLRFEPLPHKNTLGFWVNKDDTAAFDFTVETPGTFTVEVLQGCGNKSGGAEVELAVGDEKVAFTVKETGGFQAFEARDVGTLKIEKAGRHTLTVRAKTKPGVAVMDLRQIVLKPAK